jgi:hypothetical protein
VFVVGIEALDLNTTIIGGKNLVVVKIADQKDNGMHV